MLMVKMLLDIKLSLCTLYIYIYKLLKFQFVEMDVCLTAESGNTFIWIYVRLYGGGGAFNPVQGSSYFCKE